MRPPAILAALFVTAGGLAQTANCQSTSPVKKRDTELFRHVRPGDVGDQGKTGGLLIGDYFISASALQSFYTSPELTYAVRRVETVEWNKAPFDKRNAELTIRQRMDDYLDTAVAFYEGKGKRNDRQENLTDVGIGDRQLSNALQSVKMAHTWGVRLKRRHARKLALAIEKRFTIAQSTTKSP